MSAASCGEASARASFRTALEAQNSGQFVFRCFLAFASLQSPNVAASTSKCRPSPPRVAKSARPLQKWSLFLGKNKWKCWQNFCRTFWGVCVASRSKCCRFDVSMSPVAASSGEVRAFSRNWSLFPGKNKWKCSQNFRQTFLGIFDALKSQMLPLRPLNVSGRRRLDF